MIDLSVVVVNWNTCDLLGNCLSSIYSEPCPVEFEVYVVDNASSDGSAEMVRANFPQVRLIQNSENVGFARANNAAIRVCAGKNVLLLNSDTVIDPAVLSPTLQLLHSHESIGALGCRLVGLDGRQQQSHWVPNGPSAGLSGQSLEHGLVLCKSVIGAYLLVRREVIDQVGLLDEDYFMFFEDTEWCRRMRNRGWIVVFDPNHTITHVGSASCQRADPVDYRRWWYESKGTCFRKNHSRLLFELWRLQAMLHEGRCVLHYRLLAIVRPNENVHAKLAKHLGLYQGAKHSRKPVRAQTIPCPTARNLPTF